MKLTKEDILKYGLKEEISSLWRGEIYAYLEHVAEEIMSIEGPYAKHEIFMILKEVYERGGTGRGEIYAYLEYVAEEIMGIEGPHAKHEIFMILKEVYERGGTGR